MMKEFWSKISYHTPLPFVQSFLRRKSGGRPGIQSWWDDYRTIWVDEVIPETANGIKGQENGIGFGRYDQYRETYKKRFGFANSTKPDDIRRATFPISGIYYGITGEKSFDKAGMQGTDCSARYITKAVTEAEKKKLTFAPHKKGG